MQVKILQNAPNFRPFVIKIFVLFVFEGPYTVFTVFTKWPKVGILRNSAMILFLFMNIVFDRSKQYIP